MKFDKKCDLSKVVAKDDTRYALAYAKFERDPDNSYRGRLIATNGRSLAIVNVTDCQDDTDSRLLSRQALELAVKGSKGPKRTPADIHANGTVTVQTKDGPTTVASVPDDELPRFPDYLGVVPKSETHVTIGLNPKLLFELAQAIGAGESIELEIPVDSLDTKNSRTSAVGPLRVKPVRIHREEDGGAVDLENFGVIMPLSS